MFVCQLSERQTTDRQTPFTNRVTSNRDSLLAHAIPSPRRKWLESCLIILQEPRIVSGIRLWKPALRMKLKRMREVGGGVIHRLHWGRNDSLRMRRHLRRNLNILGRTATYPFRDPIVVDHLALR